MPRAAAMAQLRASPSGGEEEENVRTSFGLVGERRPEWHVWKRLEYRCGCGREWVCCCECVDGTIEASSAAVSFRAHVQSNESDCGEATRVAEKRCAAKTVQLRTFTKGYRRCALQCTGASSAAPNCSPSDVKREIFLGTFVK
eukprot:6196307-Pleurochrysis_carterae.AAC.2